MASTRQIIATYRDIEAIFKFFEKNIKEASDCTFIRFESCGYMMNMNICDSFMTVESFNRFYTFDEDNNYDINSELVTREQWLRELKADAQDLWTLAEKKRKQDFSSKRKKELAEQRKTIKLYS